MQTLDSTPAGSGPLTFSFTTPSARTLSDRMLYLRLRLDSVCFFAEHQLSPRAVLCNPDSDLRGFCWCKQMASVLMSGFWSPADGYGWDFHAPNRWDEHGRKSKHDSCFTQTAVECRASNLSRKVFSTDDSRLTSVINLADQLSLLVMKNPKIRTGLYWV